MEEPSLKQRWLPIWTLLLVGSLTFSEELESPLVGPSTPPPPAPVVETVPSELNESKAVVSPPVPWRLGLEVSGLGALSRVDYDSDFSGGFGWAIGPQLEVRLTPSLRWMTTLGYQRFSVGRFVASSGVIADEYSQFIQTQEGLFAQTVFGIPVWKTRFSAKEQVEVDWDFGGEYFHGLKARQTSSFNTEYEFPAHRFIFAVSGPTITWRLRDSWELIGSSRFFINTVGESQFKLMGVRLGLALTTPL